MVEEFERSVSRGSLEEWWVADRYDIREGFIAAASTNRRRWSHYAPFGIDELPVEFAKLKDGDADKVMDFVRRRGLLGYDYLKACDFRGSEVEDDLKVSDPIDWIQHHAMTVDLVLTMLRKKGESEEYQDPRRLADAIRAQVDVEAVKHGGLPVIRYAAGSNRSLEGHVIRDWDPKRPDIALAQLLGDILDPNLGYLRRSHYIEDGAISPSFTFPALLPVIYSLVDEAVIGAKAYVQCQGCSEWFYQTHRRQRFCPSDNPDTESLCAVRDRNRRMRVRRADPKQEVENER